MTDKTENEALLDEYIPGLDTKEPEHTETDNSNEFYESLARKHGWNPNGEKGAKEYIEFALEELPKRGTALKTQSRKIEHKDSELGQMKVILDQLANDMKKSKETAYQQALADIQAQKREAVANGDLEKFDKLEKDENNLSNNQGAQDALLEFQARNADWWDSDTDEAVEMQVYARQVDSVLIGKRLPPAEHMRKVEEKVKNKFKSYFTKDQEESKEENSNYRMSVEGVQQENNVISSKKDKVYTFRDLNDAQKAAAKYLAEQGTMTVDTYIKRLVENGDLK